MGVFTGFGAIFAEVLANALADLAVSMLSGINDDGDDELLDIIIEYLETNYPDLGDEAIELMAEAILDGI